MIDNALVIRRSVHYVFKSRNGPAFEARKTSDSFPNSHQRHSKFARLRTVAFATVLANPPTLSESNCEPTLSESRLWVQNFPCLPNMCLPKVPTPNQ